MPNASPTPTGPADRAESNASTSRVSESSDVVMAFDSETGMRPAVSSAARRDVLEGYALAGGKLSLF